MTVRAGEDFFNFNNHDMVRVAVAIPTVRVAEPALNCEQTLSLMREAAARRVALVLFPELGLTGYSSEDLHQQRVILDASRAALARVVEASREFDLVSVVGLGLAIDGQLFNCAAVIHRGRILGVVPKTYLPNYREFYEMRQFVSGEAAVREEIDLCGQSSIPFGARLLFAVEAQPMLTLAVEICEDLWVPIPPSSFAALAGATVLLNPSGSPVTVAKADYRRALVENQSARCMAAYLYAGAGAGESTTDLAWDGQGLICENGNLLAETQRYSFAPQLVCSEIDLERLAQERMRQTSFAQTVRDHREILRRFRTVRFPLQLARRGRMLPERRSERFPYVPANPALRDERCAEVYEIQVQGLATRLRAAGVKRAVIGISGGLDSTQALLVCAQAMDRLGYPRADILGYTMPGFATSPRTLEQARDLMRAIGCTARELDIRPAARQMLHDIGHPHREDAAVYDVAYENVQAGERTSHLFRLANMNDALVVGTGDLSELALGWCTYGVGDQMSHYNVNASVPKTLIQHLIRWVAEKGRLGPDASATLLKILATPISPELVPGGEGIDGPAQDTEAMIGPYELHDFSLYHVLRFGYAPPKVAFLAYCAWHEAGRGGWPDIPREHRHQYSIGQIKGHLREFLFRFFQTSQFKRSAVPNSPKVGSGGSLSPRGDWRAPSDGNASAWLASLELVPDQE